MTRSAFVLATLVVLSQVTGCGETDVDDLPPADAGSSTGPDASSPADSGTPILDAGRLRDAEAVTDVGPNDAGSEDLSGLRMACLELRRSAEDLSDVLAEAVCAHRAGLVYEDGDPRACEQVLMSCPPGGEVAIDCARVDESCDVTPAQFTTCAADFIQQIREFASGLDASVSCPVLAELARQRPLPSEPPPSCAAVQERCPRPFEGQ